MKREFLQGLGLEKEVMDKIMAENGKDIETAKKDYDELKTQFDGVSAKLKGFDGVDVAKLQESVKTLTADLATAQKKHTDEIADRDFQSAVKDAITAAKGRNVKSIMANLDLDVLKASKNQQADIKAAVEAVQKSDAYLVGETRKEPTTAMRVSTGGAHNESGDTPAANTNAQMNALIRGGSQNADD